MGSISESSKYERADVNKNCCESKPDIVYYLLRMEAYRSGHNEPHSKCGVPQGTVGSNPTASAKYKRDAIGLSFFVSPE